MKGRLLKLRDQLADSFWFLPSAMALLVIGLALGTAAIDRELGNDWLSGYGGGADGARSVLSAIAGSVMTVVSIVFSLTISTLAQTSSHYGPRVLRNFTSDRWVQLMLGTFIATFVYCLLVLRTVRSVQESTFVPYLAVTLGVVLALASMAVLIFFIHFIAQSIQTENLIAEVGQDFEQTLPRFFPAGVGQSHGRQATGVLRPRRPPHAPPGPALLDPATRRNRRARTLARHQRAVHRADVHRLARRVGPAGPAARVAGCRTLRRGRQPARGCPGDDLRAAVAHGVRPGAHLRGRTARISCSPC